ncbi:hypothetical protein C8F01DRAFT_1121369 [Mycena amicta]|nr:hypothetical protein C8F01DRAFT_1121369 [Mycena amicta]
MPRTRARTLQVEREEELVPRTVVLAKLPGLPLLPGMVMGYDAVPFKELQRRPPPRLAADYAVRFFPKGDYSWVRAEDLYVLSREEIIDYVRGHIDPQKDKRLYAVGNKRVRRAYIAAARPNAWEKTLQAKDTPAHQAQEGRQLRDDPEAIKIEGWRRQLQAAFLSPEGLSEEDVPAMDKLFDVLETYNGMTLDYLLAAKLAKVVRGIRFLEPQRLPSPDKLAFRQRANALMRKWQELVPRANASRFDAEEALSRAIERRPVH